MRGTMLESLHFSLCWQKRSLSNIGLGDAAVKLKLTPNNSSVESSLFLPINCSRCYQLHLKDMPKPCKAEVSLSVYLFIYFNMEMFCEESLEILQHFPIRTGQIIEFSKLKKWKLIQSKSYQHFFQISNMFYF